VRTLILLKVTESCLPDETGVEVLMPLAEANVVRCFI